MFVVLLRIDLFWIRWGNTVDKRVRAATSPTYRRHEAARA